MSFVYFINAQQYKKDSALVIKLFLKKDDVINADSSDNIIAYYLINFMDDSIKTKKLNNLVTSNYLSKKNWLKILSDTNWIPFVNGIDINSYGFRYISNNLKNIVSERENYIEKKEKIMKEDEFVFYLLDSCSTVRFRVNRSDIWENSLMIYKIKCEGYIDTISKYNLAKLYNEKNRDYVEGIVEFMVIGAVSISETGVIKADKDYNSWRSRRYYVNQNLKRKFPNKYFLEISGKLINTQEIKLKE